MEFRLSAIVSKEDKFFVASGVEVELASQGSTIEEALRNLRKLLNNPMLNPPKQNRSSAGL